MMGRHTFATGLFATLACSTSSLCYAQSAPASAASDVTSAQRTQAVAEVVVTARKLGETVQDAPVTVSVLNGDQVAQRGVVSANQLNGIIPGLIQMPGVAGLPATTFRGVGSNSAVFGIEASVAQYQDGIYLGRTRDTVVPLYDVDHIEFIKGTQSTLLGKNTTLGAISVVNRAPADAFGYQVAAKHTFEVSGDRLDAVLNVPVSDTLAIRVAGLYNHDNGSVKNLITGKNGEDSETYSGRVSLAWRPTDATSVRLTYQHDERREKGQSIEVAQDPIGAIRLRQQAVGQTVFDVPQDRRSTTGEGAFGTAAADQAPFDKQIASRVNLIVTAPLGDYTLTTQTAFVRWTAGYLVDLDFTRANLLNLHDTMRNKTFSEEVRLSSPAGERLSWLAGAYYYHNTYGLRRWFTLNSPIGLVPNQSSASPFQGVYGILAGRYDNDFSQATEAYSLFGSATFDFTDKLNATVGLRQTWESKDADIVRTGAGFFGTVATPLLPQTARSRRENALDYNFGLQYKPSDDWMLYASYSKGSKSGGFQDVPTTVGVWEYTGETAKSAEAGAKLSYGQARASMAVFNTLIEDFQSTFTTLINGVSVSQVGNVNLRSRGVDFDVSYRPVDGLTLGVNGTYADAKFRGFLRDSAGNAVIFPGMRAPRAPKFSGQLTATYVRPLSDRLDLTLDGQLIHTSTTYLNNLNFSTGDHPPAKSHEDLNLRVSVADSRAGWEVSLIGNNVLNQDWLVFATRVTGDGTPTVPTAALGQRSYYGNLNRPRTIAVEFKLRR